MKHIFGFCKDYGTIVYGLKHNLTLVRKTDDDALFRGAAAGAEIASLDKISWFKPHVIPFDADKFSIYMTIESKVKLPIVYIARQCDYYFIIINSTISIAPYSYEASNPFTIARNVSKTRAL